MNKEIRRFFDIFIFFIHRVDPLRDSQEKKGIF